MPNRDHSYYDYDSNPEPKRDQSSINFDPRSQRADRDDWGPNPTSIRGGDYRSFSGASQGLGAQGTGWHEARYGVQNEFDAARRYHDRDFSQNRNPNENQSRVSHAGKGPKGYRRSDERIHEEICDALTHDPHVDASDIEIRVENGVVTLSGTVDNRRMKRDAEDCAENRRGVDDVKNELKVRKADLWDKIKGQEARNQEAKGQRMDGSATVASAKLQ